MSESNGKPKPNKFAYLNKFFEVTAKHLTKSEVAVWMCLWNFAMPKGERLIAEVSITKLAGYLNMKRPNASALRSELKNKGLLRPVGTAGNRVELLALCPVMKSIEAPSRV